MRSRKLSVHILHRLLLVCKRSHRTTKEIQVLAFVRCPRLALTAVFVVPLAEGREARARNLALVDSLFFALVTLLRPDRLAHPVSVDRGPERLAAARRGGRPVRSGGARGVLSPTLRHSPPLPRSLAVYSALPPCLDCPVTALRVVLILCSRTGPFITRCLPLQIEWS